MSQLLPLLPSGPGGVHSLSLRGDQQEIPSNVNTPVRAITAVHYGENGLFNQVPTRQGTGKLCLMTAYPVSLPIDSVLAF